MCHAVTVLLIVQHVIKINVYLALTVNLLMGLVYHVFLVFTHIIACVYCALAHVQYVLDQLIVVLAKLDFIYKQIFV